MASKLTFVAAFMILASLVMSAAAAPIEDAAIKAAVQELFGVKAKSQFPPTSYFIAYNFNGPMVSCGYSYSPYSVLQYLDLP